MTTWNGPFSEPSYNSSSIGVALFFSNLFLWFIQENTKPALNACTSFKRVFPVCVLMALSVVQFEGFMNTF